MNLVFKTVLYSYPSFDGVLDGIEKLAYFKALTSYADSNKTLKQIDKILLLNNQADRLKNLKRIVNELLDGLTEEERELLSYKFFRYPPSPGFDYSSRRYFRMQKKLAEKLDKIAKRRGYDERWFSDNFSDIYFLKAKFERLKSIEQRKTVPNAARDSGA